MYNITLEKRTMQYYHFIERVTPRT